MAEETEFLFDPYDGADVPDEEEYIDPDEDRTYEREQS